MEAAAVAVPGEGHLTFCASMLISVVLGTDAMAPEEITDEEAEERRNAAKTIMSAEEQSTGAIRLKTYRESVCFGGMWGRAWSNHPSE